MQDENQTIPLSKVFTMEINNFKESLYRETSDIKRSVEKVGDKIDNLAASKVDKFDFIRYKDDNSKKFTKMNSTIWILFGFYSAIVGALAIINAFREKILG